MRPLNKPSRGVKNTTSVKAARSFPHIFILWLRAGDDGGSRALNLRWHHVTPDDAKISSETAFFHPCGCVCTSSRGLKGATLHHPAGRELTFTRRWCSACFLCSFMKKEKSSIRKANYRGRRGQTEGWQQIIGGLKAGLTNKDKHVAWQHVGPAAEEVTQTELGIKMKVAP